MTFFSGLLPSWQKSTLDFPIATQNCSTSDSTSKFLTPLPFILYKLLPLQVFLTASPSTPTASISPDAPICQYLYFLLCQSSVFTSFLLHPTSTAHWPVTSPPLHSHIHSPNQIPSPDPHTCHLLCFSVQDTQHQGGNHTPTKADVATGSWSPFSRGSQSCPANLLSSSPRPSKAISNLLHFTSPFLHSTLRK